MKEYCKTSQLQLFLIISFSAVLLFQLFCIYLIVKEMHWLGPVQDFWGSIPFIEKTLASGNWFNSDLWLAQNNHRLVLPRLAFLIDYHFFYGSNWFLTSLGAALIFLEILVLFWLLKPKFIAQDKQQTIIFIVGTSILTIPLVSYNLLHTFNSQWIQCAFLALLSCITFAKGLKDRRTLLIIVSLIAAIACSFTTFTLLAIWPTLFLLLILNKTKIRTLAVFGLFVVAFTCMFIFLLPTDSRTGGNYDFGIFITALSQIKFISFIAALTQYLVDYLSLPGLFIGNITSKILTIVSLTWLIFSLFSNLKHKQTWVEESCLTVTFFVICLGLTTGLGRVFVGDVGLGPRFGPIVLLYWCSVWVYLLTYFKNKNSTSFLLSATFCLVWLILTTAIAANNTSKRLAEDYNRFARSQMAYITNNLDIDAIYENLVPEWRSTSYPGIIAALPYLQQNQLGIFHSVFAQQLEQGLPADLHSTANCLQLKMSQKARNDNENIRSVNFIANNNITVNYSYLAIYSDSEIIGAAFKKRISPIQEFFQNKTMNSWLGISKKNLDLKKLHVVAYSEDGAICRAQINE